MKRKIRKDRALKIGNARMLCGMYFALLAVVFTLCLDASLYALGINQMIPLFAGTLVAMFIAWIFGFIFGERIIHAKSPYKARVFGLGFVKTFCALPFYCLGFLVFYLQANPGLWASLNFGGLLHLYLKIIVFSASLIGIWLAILSGLAALYLRAILVYYIYDSADD